jgi:hypothetical protein
MEVSGQFHIQVALSPEKEVLYQLNMGLIESLFQTGLYGEENISCSCRDRSHEKQKRNVRGIKKGGKYEKKKRLRGRNKLSSNKSDW